MADNIPYLSGGIFFTLLLQARKQRIKARDKASGGSDGLADTEVLKDLINVVARQDLPPHHASFKKNTSEYKSCQYSSGAYIPFNEPFVTSGFDNEVKNKYSDTLKRMSEFVNKYLDVENTSKMEWLIKALLETIELDTEIKEQDSFYIQKDGQPLIKKELLVLENIELQPFLLGILHFIILNRPDNTPGRSTYEAWHQQEMQHSERKFASDIGSNINRPLKVSIIPTQEETASEDRQDFSESSEGGDDVNSKIVNQYINNPTIVNQHGDKNIHIEHVHTLRL